MTTWNNLLENTKVRDVMHITNVISVPNNQKVRQTLEVLKGNNILSVPVYEGEKAIGFVDVLDISAYALDLWKNYAKSYRRKEEKFFSESEIAEKFFDTPVSDIVNYSGRNSFLQLDENASLGSAISLLQSRGYKAHRVAVMRNERQLVGLLTQFDVATFINHHIDAFLLADRSLRDLNLVNTCVMVRLDRPFLDSLSLLAEHKITGLALVDWEFKLEANFSASDLKGMLPGAFDLFWKPTIDFLRQGTTIKSKIPPKMCEAGASIRQALNIMISEHIHRIFVTDENSRLEGVFTLTDLIGIAKERSVREIA